MLFHWIIRAIGCQCAPCWRYPLSATAWLAAFSALFPSFFEYECEEITPISPISPQPGGEDAGMKMGCVVLLLNRSAWIGRNKGERTVSIVLTSGEHDAPGLRPLVPPLAPTAVGNGSKGEDENGGRERQNGTVADRNQQPLVKTKVEKREP